MFTFKGFTRSANAVLNTAIESAAGMGHTYIGSEHLLIGLLAEGSIPLTEQGITAEKLENFLLDTVGSGTPLYLSPRDFTPHAKRILELAVAQSRLCDKSQVTPEHLFAALLQEEDNFAVRFLRTQGVDTARLYERYVEELPPPLPPPAEKGKKGSALARFTRDLTHKARRGELDPVIGREKEIDRLLRILSRRTKNNPCLVGEAGVGKTAVAEGLAQRLAASDLPETLRGKRLLQLDIAAMVAGTKYRGDFEDRMKNCLDEASRDRNLILFVDEIHTIVGAGAAEGAIDAANILKPALARGELRLLGATTAREYRRYIAKDAALERRFQEVAVNEPTPAQTLTVLEGLCPQYEVHHNTTIPHETLQVAVELAERFLPDRRFPDKALDLIDEAAAQTKLSGENNVTPDAVRRVLSERVGVPLQKLTTDERVRLQGLEAALSEAVIGQEQAVKTVAAAVRRARIGLKPDHRPAGAFLFVGPTGVGKTELAKALAKALFDRPDALIKLDMSEYKESHATARLVGAPPGYVGYEQESVLSEKLRQNPYSVVLFDEVEKAHPDLHNLLLQILEDGTLTDAQGNVMHFQNATVILTANIGARESGKAAFGFAEETPAQAQARCNAAILSAVKTVFRPELVNRLDEIVAFSPLDKAALLAVARHLADDLTTRARKAGCTLTVTDAALAKLVEHAYDPQYGARTLRRSLQKEVETPLSDLLCAENSPDAVTVTVEDEKITVQTTEKGV